MQSLQGLHGRVFSQLGCCGGFSLISQLSAHETWDDNPINGGTPLARWFMSWKIPSRKGMMTAGNPHDFGNPQTIPTSTAGACSWPGRGGLTDNGFGNNFGAGPWGDWIRWPWAWHSPIILPLLISEDHHPKVAWKAPWTSFEILWAQKKHEAAMVADPAIWSIMVSQSSTARGPICEENQLRGRVEM